MKRVYLGVLGVAALLVSTASTCQGPGTVSGFVRMDGQAYPGILVYFERWPYCGVDCSAPQTHSDANGHYSIDLPEGTYSARCQWEQLEPKIACWANADGTPRIITVPPGGQTVDFVVLPI
jgi:hypothetical protein